MDLNWKMPDNNKDIYYFDIIMNNINQIEDIQTEIDFFLEKEMYRECAILEKELEKRKLNNRI